MIRFWVLVPLIFGFGNLLASPVTKDVPIIFSSNETLQSFGPGLKIFTDSSSSLQPREVLQMEFEPNSLAVPNLGVSSFTHWVKFSIINKTDSENILIQLAYPIMDYAALYRLDSNHVKIQELGDEFIFDQRTYDHPNLIFDANISKDDTANFLLEIRSGEQILVPLSVGTLNEIYESNSNVDLVYGVYLGIVLVMLLYNLFIYFSVRDKSYLYYVMYIFTVGMVQISFPGYSLEYLWPDNLWLAQHGLLLMGALSGISIMLFMNNFLQIKTHAPKLRFLAYAIIGIYCIPIITTLFDFYNLSYSLIDVSGAILSFSALIIAIKISIKGYRPARFFLIAWTIFLVGLFVFIFRSFGVLPYNNFTNYTMPIGSAIEVVLLSFALADRINILKKEKEESQAQALRVSQENERLVLEQNVILEQKVEERTEELRESNTDLNTALDTLKSAQSQLVDAEKMASLGQLTAGIAHEINNPINFVTSNIKPLHRDIQDMLSLIEKYNEINPEVDLIQKLSEIKEFRDDLDVDYVIEEMDSLLKGIDEGAQRTAEIVRGLKNFSRLDEAELKDADINEGLLSTLTVLNSNISRSEVELIKELGTIPVIECYPGKLNQVFMNIITNGIQAVNGNKAGTAKKILVKSDLVGDNIVIRIKDNGPGIPDEVRAKIFEPFFTTKDVGEGTGLGLSIVHSIIESHKGEIVLESAPGEGTEFIISLPVKK